MEEKNPNLPKGFFHGKLVLADNSVLAPFVDAGHARLLYDIVGCVLVAPSIIDPNPPNLQSPPDLRALPEFNRYIVKTPLPPQLIVARRLDYLMQNGHFWNQDQLTEDELRAVQSFKKTYKKLRKRYGDLETLAIGKQRNGIILTNDYELALAAQKEGVQTFFPCRLLVLAVQWGLISCPDAENLYNNVFVEQLKLWSTKRLRCEGQEPICIDV